MASTIVHPDLITAFYHALADRIQKGSIGNDQVQVLIVIHIAKSRAEADLSPQVLVTATENPAAIV